MYVYLFEASRQAENACAKRFIGLLERISVGIFLAKVATFQMENHTTKQTTHPFAIVAATTTLLEMSMILCVHGKQGTLRYE